jgi:hypothetical protein
VESPGAWVELPSVAEVRLAVAPEGGQPHSLRKDLLDEGVRFERVPRAASAGAGAPAALQPPVAMHSAGEAETGAGEAASRSTFEFGWAVDSTRAEVAATRDGRSPDPQVGKRADSPLVVWPFPHSGGTRFSMAEHRGRTVGTPS